MICSKYDITPENLQKELNDITTRLNLNNINEALYFPRYFQIETIRKCNANCIFCPKEKWDKSVPYISDELFEKIAKELEEYAEWITFVDVQRVGEPLLDKKLPAKISRLKEAGIKCVIFSTNASLLSEDIAERLLDAGLDEIMLSFDSIEKEEYEEMRVGLKFEKVMKNILGFFELREKVKPAMRIRVRGVSFNELDSSLHRERVKKWEEFWTPYRKPQDRIYMKRIHSWGNQQVEGFTLENPEVFHPCILPWSTVHITTKGTVTMCPHDFNAVLELGDVNKNTIKEIWNNSKFEHIRELHESGRRNEIPFCRKCVIFDLDYSMEDWQQKDS